MGKLANLNNVVGDGRSLESVKSRYQERLAEFCVNRATMNRCSIVRQGIDSPLPQDLTVLCSIVAWSPASYANELGVFDFALVALPNERKTSTNGGTLAPALSMKALVS